MSVPDFAPGQVPADIKKRKLEQDEELEVQLDAPEPPSKKALRKAKKAKTSKGIDGDIHIDRKHQILDPTNEINSGGQTPQEPTRRSDYGIWIGNLAFITTTADLQSFFARDTVNVIAPEEISRINLPKGIPRNGKDQNKGFAYVDFTNPKALQKALQLSEKLLTGRRVLIKDAKNFEGRPKATEVKKTEVPSSKRIFVGNLGFDITTDDLKSHLQPCGVISNVHMATFEDSGKCKGYAWIEFDQLSSAESAMRGWVEQSTSEAPDSDRKAGKRRIWVNKIEGRKLRMEYAEDKTTRYNKRYGKNPHKEEDVVLGEVDASETIDHAGGRKETTKATHSKPKREKRPHQNADDSQPTRYAASTVAKLKGSIVEGKGTKVTFD